MKTPALILLAVLCAACLVRHPGFPVDEAYARGTAMGIGEMPFARMIDGPVKVVPAG